ncbi:xylose isomerase, partial [Priestia megaterium]
MVQTSTNKINYFESANKVLYEGKDSKNPLAFKYYNPDEVVGGKTMKDQLRFSVAYWHTFTADGTDPFGAATMQRSWDRYDGMDLAKARVEAAFQLFETLNVPFFAFHDRDVAPEGSTLQETNKNLDVIVTMIKEYMQTSNV